MCLIRLEVNHLWNFWYKILSIFVNFCQSLSLFVNRSRKLRTVHLDLTVPSSTPTKKRELKMTFLILEFQPRFNPDPRFSIQFFFVSFPFKNSISDPISSSIFILPTFLNFQKSSERDKVTDAQRFKLSNLKKIKNFSFICISTRMES